MTQTAVEWLEEKMKTWGDLPRWMRDDIVEQAKAMEKEQIKNAYIKGHFDSLFGMLCNSEKYYNENFKSE